MSDSESADRESWASRLMLGPLLRKFPPVVRREALLRLGGIWRRIIPTIVILWGASLAYMSAATWLEPYLGLPRGAFPGCWMASFFPTAGVLFWRIRVRLRSNIEDILREAKYRFCPHCQYDLTGLDPSGICPECGRRFSPDLLGVMWLSKIDRW